MKREETERLIQLYIDEKKQVLNKFPIREVLQATEMVWRVYLNGGTIYACGNGGNASYVGNLVCDLSMHPFVSDDKTKPMPQGIKRLRAFDLTASGTNITGISNDFGYEHIFRQQLINDGIKSSDLLFGFSGSGNSRNVLEAMKLAKESNAKTIAITRGDGGKSKDLADLCILIPGSSEFPGQIGGNDNNFHFEDSLSSIPHIITGIMRQRITDLYSNEISK